MSKNTKVLLIINTIRKVIDIFLGPFLTAYLFKVAIDNIKTISIYNAYSYVVIAFSSILVGFFIKNKFKMQVFRIGMISKFMQLLILVLLGNQVVKYIWLLAIISGLSMETWSFPLNILSSTLVEESEKKEYVVYRTVLTNLVKVLLPFLLGTIITMKSFTLTAIVILILSFIQIIISFAIKEDLEKSNKQEKLHLLEEIKKIKNNTRLKQFYRIKIFKGMAYEGALDTAVTLLIIISFKSDFSLGIITSIVSFLSVISSYIYKQLKNDKNIIMTSAIVLFISSIILILTTNEISVIIYNLIFSFFIQFIIVAEELQTLKFTNSEYVTNKNRVETFIILEFFLNFGRIISYILLFIVGIYTKLYMLELLIIILMGAIILESINYIRFKSNF